MAKKTTAPKSIEADQRPRGLPSREDLRAHFNLKESAITERRFGEIFEMLFLPDNTPQEQLHTKLVRAVELFESLVPNDGAEGMLALEMVGTHDAGLDCLRRAALRSQTSAGRDMVLKHAHKLMLLYTQQLATLNKHRGKGQQEVTVEHVNVAPGGQAIVGHVTHDGRAADWTSSPTLEHRQMPDVQAPTSAATVKRGRS